MALTPGTRLGSYEIVSVLGTGGMGEVYRAIDTKLKRQVAVKILPPSLAADPDTLARFQREAEVLASLNHQHIAAIYGLEECASADAGQAPMKALVMELVEGEDLSQRITRGPLTIEDALSIARQVAEALETAHEQGIVHRDLKPANLKIRPDGTVKVLDFGLAKALDLSTGSRQPGVENSPTITSPAMTMPGMILGTAAYMSPEQARGKPVDRRTDIWAFGCVLFEMLAGQQAFASGQSVSDAIAAILSRDPDWNALPRATPPHIRTLLTRCLNKDAQKRLPHIGVARLEIDEGPGQSTGTATPAPTPTGIAKRLRLATAIAILLLIAALGIAVTYLRRPAAVVSPTYTSSIVPPSDLLALPGDRLALSPDGQQVAFVAAGEDGRPMLWVRPLSSTTAKPLDGTQGGSSPFWSPDSRQLAFAAGGKLKRIDSAGGAAITLTDTDTSLRGAWSPDGVILFPQAKGLFKVAVAGGPPSPVVAMPELAYYPSFLPDGRHFLYLSARSIYVASLDRAEPQQLLDNAGNAMYALGHLLFIRETTLYAQPFDPDRRMLSGSPFSLAERVQISTGSGAGAFSVSPNGVLVYQSTSAGLSQLAWFDRNGRRIKVMGEAALYHPDPRLSADGSRGVVSVIGAAGDESDIWSFDVDRDVKSRITYDPADEIDPLLSPDGRRVVFSSRRGQRKGVYLKTLESNAAPELILEEDQWTKVPLSFSPDGHYLLYSMFHPQTSFDLWVLALSGERKPASYVRTVGDERHGAFSPDGRWIVYESSESGRNEVYVAPFPATGAKWPVSTSGGESPHWRGDGKEMFFLHGNAVMRADVTLSPNRVVVGAVQPLFEAQRFRRTGASNPFAVSADGQRFLFNISTQTGPDPVTLVINWAAGLR